MPRPICFMIMPYSVKSTGTPPPAGAPDKINFDRLWEAALRPAIDKAGYEPVRANEDVGALIITEMIERLAISDMVLADMSIPNGNVYYEVGIRHAAAKKGCMLVGANWSKALFDVDQMRQIRYPLPEESITDATAAEIIEIISKAIPAMADGASPFYQTLPKWPDYELERATAFKKSLEDLSKFQAEVKAVRAASGPLRAERALELKQKYHKEPIQQGVAIELLYILRDCCDWKTTLEFIDSLPAAMQQSSLVKEQRALAQAKSGDIDESIGALETLMVLSGETSERFGLLGGRWKKKWGASKDPADLDRAIEAYEAGMKLDLNDYYPSCNLPRLYRARNEDGDKDKARIAQAITQTACERAKARNSKDEWLNPTLLGAAFDVGDVQKVRELAKTVRKEGAAKWKLETTIDDCERAAEMHEEPKRAELMAIVADLRKLL